jgi:Spy/CpxP family protein refolding chaperone
MKILDNKRIFLAVIILLTLINMGFVFSVIVMQQQSGEKGEGYPRGLMERPRQFMKDEVGFTDNQMEEFHNMRQEFRAQMEPLHSDLRELKSELLNEATSENPDTDKCNMLSESIGKIHTKINQNTSQHLMKVSRIATPEQSAKLKEFYENMFNSNPDHNPGAGRKFRHRGQNPHVN